MPRRKSFSRKERVRLFELYKGECHICEGKIHVNESWEIEHVIPWDLTQDDSDDNLRLAHFKCHKIKSAGDVKAIRKANRIRDKHNGAVKKKSSFACSRQSKWKKKLNGEVVPR